MRDHPKPSPAQPHNQAPVFGMPLDELLINVWFDGFTSGAASGCGLFLPAAAADAKADELAAAALDSAPLRAHVQAEVRERTRDLMQQVMSTGKPIPGLSPSDLQQP